MAAVVLFDGVCNLCSWIVHFVAARDPYARYRFAPLGSAAAMRLLQDAGLSVGAADSIVLIEDGRAYVRSAAALRIVRRLRFPWPLAYAFIIVPRRLRDAVYDWVSRNRFRWFGRRETCLVPSSVLEGRFLIDSPAEPPLR